MEHGSSLQAYAEQYFSSGSSINRRIIEDIESIRESYDDTWDHLNQRQQDQVINEHIITPEVAMQISNQEKSTSFPRLKITSGQKMIVVEGNTSEGGENKGYSYRDEHSEPFSWKTRSQQDLQFDLLTNSRGSTPETGSSENLELVSSRRSAILTPDVGSAENLEIISARRSAILSCPFGQYSKLRREAKPVAIPVVPMLKKPIAKKQITNGDKKVEKHTHGDSRKLDYVEDVDEIISLTSSVVVADSSNNIVLDFTMAGFDENIQSNSLPACSTELTNGKEASSSSTFSSTLSSSFSFVKGKTNTLKKSLTPTLRRKKSTASTDTTCSVATELEFLSGAQSLSSTPTHDEVPRYSPSRAFLKPSHPPPPPPGSRPTAPPPPPPALVRSKPTPPLPPTRDPSTKISQSSLDHMEETENIYQNQAEVFKNNKPLVKVTQPPEESIQPNPEATQVFSSEVLTSETSLLCSRENDDATSLTSVEKKEIAKTGFDFLDNW